MGQPTPREPEGASAFVLSHLVTLVIISLLRGAIGLCAAAQHVDGQCAQDSSGPGGLGWVHTGHRGATWLCLLAFGGDGVVCTFVGLSARVGHRAGVPLQRR